MRTSNGQKDCHKDKHSKNVNDSSEAKISVLLNSKEKEFLDFIRSHDTYIFIKSLEMIHDFAFYHTDLCFNIDEKKAFFYLKTLWEEMAKLEN